MGLIFDVASYRGTPYKATLTTQSYENIPKSASLLKYCPTPGDQGAYGTCAAFAIAYHTRTILWGIEHQETSRSTLNRQAFSAAFLYDQVKAADDADCQGGSNPILGLEILRTLGVPRTTTVPYVCEPTISDRALAEAVDFPIKDYQILFMPEEQSRDVRVNTVRKSISEGWPVVLAFIVPESFYNPPAIWKPLATDGGPSGKHGRHAMVVVGYDDTKGGNGAFHVLNSWGPGWAENGYVWIPYEAFAQYALGAIQVYGERPPPPPPPPPAPPAPAPSPRPSPSPAPVTPPAPVPAYNSLLEGRIAFQRNDGVSMLASRIVNSTPADKDDESLSAYKLDQPYPSGTRFRFFIQTNTEVYLYAFATDRTQEITQILPFEDNMSPLIGPNSTLAFPSERKVVRMDNQPGTDYLLILYSSERLDPAALRRKFDVLEGSLSHKIKVALGERLVPADQVKYDDAGIGFSVERKAKGSVVPLMVEIQHH